MLKSRSGAKSEQTPRKHTAASCKRKLCPRTCLCRITNRSTKSQSEVYKDGVGACSRQLKHWDLGSTFCAFLAPWCCQLKDFCRIPFSSLKTNPHAKMLSYPGLHFSPLRLSSLNQEEKNVCIRSNKLIFPAWYGASVCSPSRPEGCTRGWFTTGG